MRSSLSYYTLCILIISAICCRKDFEYAPNTGNLEFSQDTIFLDTIFSNIGSSTYTLKVYNRSNEDISIPNIQLGEGQDSGYRLNVDGVAGKFFYDIPLNAKDSLFIFIETTFDISKIGSIEFLYTDVLQFDEGDKRQEIPLVTLVKDAVFLFPSKSSNGIKETVSIGLDANGDEIHIEGFELDADQLNFTNEKPYVIYGYAVVTENNTLLIDAGTRVYFHKNSGVLVKSKASLQIMGELSTDAIALEKEVIFEGDRLESEFENIPGQWGGILIAAGSAQNTINHLTIKNATVGLRVEGDNLLENPTLDIKNTQIYNSASFNLLGISAFVNGENLVLGDAGSHSLYCNIGGNYSFAHTTIANYWTDSFRTGAALAIDNSGIDSSGNPKSADLTRANFQNCIVDGNGDAELSLIDNGANNFNYYFKNCIIKHENRNASSDNPLYDFNNSGRFENIILNENLEFNDVLKNDFRLSAISPAVDKANLETALTVPFDILGKNRQNLPDIGAFEFNTEN